MKRIAQIHWSWRLLAALTLLVLTGIGLNPLYRWHVNRSLVFATERGDSREIHRRLAEGANVNALVPDKLTKPTAGLYLNTLLRGKNAIPRYRRTTLLMVAVVSGHADIARELLEHGAQVDAPDEFGFTALSMAISLKRPDLVKLLLDYHANPNATNLLGMPPLNWALMLKQNECAMLLLHAGADANGRDKDELPALYLAALSENMQAVEMLLDCKANPNIVYKGCSVMRMAIEDGYADTVQALLRNGAHLYDGANDSNGLIDLAKSKHHQDIALMLRKAAATQ